MTTESAKQFLAGCNVLNFTLFLARVPWEGLAPRYDSPLV